MIHKPDPAPPRPTLVGLDPESATTDRLVALARSHRAGEDLPHRRGSARAAGGRRSGERSARRSDSGEVEEVLVNNDMHHGATATDVSIFKDRVHGMPVSALVRGIIAILRLRRI